MKQIWVMALGAGLLLVASGAAQAKDETKPPTPKPEAMLRLFDGACADNVPHLSRVKSFAQALKWKTLPPEAAAMGAPLAPNAKFEGWSAKEDGHLFVLGWSEAVIDGKMVTTCTIMTKDVPADALAALIGKKYTVRPLDDMREAYKRVRVWNATINGEQALINLLNPVDAGFEAATLAVVIRR